MKTLETVQNSDIIYRIAKFKLTWVGHIVRKTTEMSLSMIQIEQQKEM